MGWRVTGKRVAFTRKLHGNEKRYGGTYQQYCVADALTVMVLDEKLDYNKGCMSLVNPLTAMGLLDRLVFLRSRVFV